VEGERGVKIKVRRYVNLEINSNIQKVWDQILIELKRFVEDMWEEVQCDYTEELV
jgi:hypothetical protein